MLRNAPKIRRMSGLRFTVCLQRCGLHPSVRVFSYNLVLVTPNLIRPLSNVPEVVQECRLQHATCPSHVSGSSSRLD